MCGVREANRRGGQTEGKPERFVMWRRWERGGIGRVVFPTVSGVTTVGCAIKQLP